MQPRKIRRQYQTKRRNQSQRQAEANHTSQNANNQALRKNSANQPPRASTECLANGQLSAPREHPRYRQSGNVQASHQQNECARNDDDIDRHAGTAHDFGGERLDTGPHCLHKSRGSGVRVQRGRD